MGRPDFGRTLATGSVARPEPLLKMFHTAVLDHYRVHRRDFPWRRTRDPYSILVSEVMLQQTQVGRVLAKYEEFLACFPDVRALAVAPTAAVLRAWQGLGYNRRALALLGAAQVIVEKHQGAVPGSYPDLRSLPGVGPATAAAVGVFAFGLPLAFIETNIRAAFLHFFFQEGVAVPDAELLPLVELTLDRENPRDWYYALMDYGNWVKKNFPNPNRRSKHHTVQTGFAGSHRQLRAQILRSVLDATAEAPEQGGAASTGAPTLDAMQIGRRCRGWDMDEVRAALKELANEGFLHCEEGGYRIA